MIGLLLKNSKLDLTFTPDGRVLVSGIIDPADLRILEENSEVTEIEPDYVFSRAQDSFLFNLTNIREPNAPYYGLNRISGANSSEFVYPYEAGYGRVRALALMNAVYSTSVTVYVLDTGVQRNHTEFTEGQVIGGFSAFGTDPYEDPNGHGMALCCIAREQRVLCRHTHCGQHWRQDLRHCAQRAHCAGQGARRQRLWHADLGDGRH